MLSLVPKSFASLAATLLLLAGCGDPEAHTLTGVYSLQSASSADWTEGATLTPPALTGVLRLDQYSFGSHGASGNVLLEMTYTLAPPGSRTSTWRGSYSNQGSGYFTTKLNDVRFEGEYILDGNTLTTDLSADVAESGPSLAGTIVWARNTES